AAVHAAGARAEHSLWLQRCCGRGGGADESRVCLIDDLRRVGASVPADHRAGPDEPLRRRRAGAGVGVRRLRQPVFRPPDQRGGGDYGGGDSPVRGWVSGDYDSLYVVRLTNAGGAITAQFTHEYEGLNNLPTSCQ